MVKRIFIAVVFVVVCGFPANVFGQKPVIIKLDNSSFEDYPGVAHTPEGWLDCGFMGESAPDVQPSGTFSVNRSAFHGSTYPGMVVRDNNIWEAVGQKLNKPLLENVRYQFSIHACQSETYMSRSRITGDSVNYIIPAVIKIWGGDDLCAKKQLLAQSQAINFKD